LDCIEKGAIIENRPRENLAVLRIVEEAYAKAGW
jgi:hypothetical protein